MREYDPLVEELFGAEVDRKRKKDAESVRGADELRLAVRAVLDSAGGMLLLNALIDETGVFASSFTGNSTTFFLEGKRAVGLFLYRLLMDADPLALQKLVDYRRGQLQQKKGLNHE